MTVSLAANALTTVEAVAGDLGLTLDDANRQLLARHVNAVSEAIERYCGRKFYRTSGIVEKVKGYGTERLLLERTPVESVASVVISGTTLSSDLYSIEDVDTGTLFNLSGWADTARYARAAGPQRIGGTEAALYTVTYTGGYVMPAALRVVTGSMVALPYDLEEAAIGAAVALFRQKGTDRSIIAEGLGDASVQYDREQGGILPAWVRQTLAGYKRER